MFSLDRGGWHPRLGARFVWLIGLALVFLWRWPIATSGGEPAIPRELNTTRMAAPALAERAIPPAAFRVSLSRSGVASALAKPPARAAVYPHEPPGPSSRKTPMVISEIMYRPAPTTNAGNLEFVELYNSNPFFHDLGGYQLLGDKMSFTFPVGTLIPAGAILVVAASPGDLVSAYGITNAVGPYQGNLKKADTLRLLSETGAVLLTVPYSNQSPWPVAADGTGHSLVLANPTYGEADPRAWDLSDAVGGSPGQPEPLDPNPVPGVTINEWFAPSEDSSGPGWIELFNPGAQPVDLSGCVLTDDAAAPKFVLPPNTEIASGGFLSFDQTRLGFGLNPAGGTIFLLKPEGGGVLDAVPFEAQAEGVSYGRWPDGANAFYPLAAPTPGSSNGPVWIGDIVINELMYHPIGGNDDDQYIELYNRGTHTVSLANWRFEAGVTFTFPESAFLAPDSYLVIARHQANLLAKYPNLNSANTLGDFAGRLSHAGERVALAMPRQLAATNSQGSKTVYVVVDEVTYGTGGRWGQWADGGGASLELIDPHANHRLAANWADSDDTAKSTWTTIETTGVLDQGGNYGSSFAYAQLGLLDAGECLVDDVEVRSGTTNYVANPDFETGVSSWSMQGCHSRSSLDNTGFASGHSLRVRCGDRLWTGVNSCQVALNANPLAAGQTATLRFKARWLHGWPEALLRLNGNWLEATGALPVPSNLGTPGAPNSRAVANAGPAVYEVTHTPALPATNQPVVVTARVHDPDGVRDFILNYRIDPATSYRQVPMTDTGTGGDAVAGDGLFSAAIPGQAAGKIVAFYLSATDGRAAATRFPALVNDNAPARECAVMLGDSNPSGHFGAYHLWVTQTNAQRWSSLSDLSNESHDCTFVNGNRVIYNTQARFAGSPYHQNFDKPDGNLCHYKWTFPEDDKFLGATSFNKIHQPGNGAGDDNTIQREQLANSLLRALGVPWLNRRYVAVYVNGKRRGTLMEDAQTPDGDLVKEYFPDDAGGYLYKMQPWFEFSPFPSGNSIGFNNNSWCTLMPYTTTGGAKKTARYRYNYLVRRTPSSASDFAPVFALVDAAGSYGSPGYAANLAGLADMENWMRVFAANHAAGNWDAFGAQNAQNLYGYLGLNGTKYSLLMWDFNIVFGNSGSWGAGQNLFAVNGADPNVANIYKEPVFRRMYWRALQELVNGPLDAAKSGPLLDAKYAAFKADGVTVTSPSALKTWLTSAQSSIAAQIAAENASTFTVNPSVKSSNGVAFVSGKAPVAVKTVQVNGVAWPVTWTSVTDWTVKLPLQPGTNVLSVVAVDVHGQPLPGASNRLAVVERDPEPDAAGQIVINEIMYQPKIPGAEYIELYNRSTNTAFDLSGFQVRGLAYSFPPGSLIEPRGYLVLVANRLAFAAAYGAANPVFDTFPGTLSTNGETLTLLRPAAADTNLVVAQVRYQAAPPWPAAARGTGSSLQLIDAAQDLRRVANWAATTSNSPPPAPQWQHATLTGIATKSTLLIGMTGGGDVYLDDLSLVAGSVAEAGPNLLDNSDFERPLSGTWTVSANVSGSAIDTTVKHSGQSSLRFAATSGGATIDQAIWQTTTTLTTNATYTLSYWYLAGKSPGTLLLRLWGSSPNSGHIYSLQPVPLPTARATIATPGAANSVQAVLPTFPTLWINEVLPDPSVGGSNASPRGAGWLELYNTGTNTASLAGLYLANNYANLTQWAFPATENLPPGGYRVIVADGQPELSTPGEPHTSFTLPVPSGPVALSRLDQGQIEVLDYVDYVDLAPNVSYGSLPDGQNLLRQAFAFPTPGSANVASFNSAPALQTVGDQSVYLGQSFRLLVRATDPDLPPQTLSFSLDPGAPPGAAIDPRSGLFTWTPAPAQAPGPYGVTARVTDSGVPPRWASQSFTLTALPAPTLAALSRHGESLTLTWPTVPGRRYRLESTADLTAPAWTPLGSDQAATGATLAADVNLPTGAARFYRLTVLPEVNSW